MKAASSVILWGGTLSSNAPQLAVGLFTSLPRNGKVLAKLGCGIWENEYVKEDGKWKFKKLFFNDIFATPYEDGWVKTPYVRRPLPQDRPASGPNTHFAPYPSGHIFPYHYKNPVTGK